jgi:hypothetical protein
MDEQQADKAALACELIESMEGPELEDIIAATLAKADGLQLSRVLEATTTKLLPGKLGTLAANLQDPEVQEDLEAQLPQAMKGSVKSSVRTCIAYLHRADPKLWECTLASLKGAILDAHAAGVPIDGTYGYLVPRKRNVASKGQPKRYITEAHFEVAYQGLIAVAIEDGAIDAHCTQAGIAAEGTRCGCRGIRPDRAARRSRPGLGLRSRRVGSCQGGGGSALGRSAYQGDAGQDCGAANTPEPSADDSEFTACGLGPIFASRRL